jgi:hypothetical protein
MPSDAKPLATRLYLWICDTCFSSVFMPRRHAGKILRGGVCTQRKRGCTGNLRRASDAETEATVTRCKHDGLKLQPWLTMIPSAASIERARKALEEMPS